MPNNTTINLLKGGPNQPTIKQKKAFEILVANGSKTVAGAMKEAGYSEKTARDPSKLTKSQGFKQLLDDSGLNDQSIANTHIALLDAAKIEKLLFPNISGKKTGQASDAKIKEIIESIPQYRLLHVITTKIGKLAIIAVPDRSAQIFALTMALKIKGYLSPNSQVGFTPHVLTEEEKTMYNNLFEKNK